MISRHHHHNQRRRTFNTCLLLRALVGIVAVLIQSTKGQQIQLGEDCEEDKNQCASGLKCANSVCKIRDLESCNDNKECKSGICGDEDSICKKLADERCEENSQCGSDICKSNICRAPDGGTCDQDRICDSSICEGLVCIQPKSNGDSCIRDQVCNSEVCEESIGICIHPKRNKASCNRDRECASGYCNENKICRSCNRDRECASGYSSGYCNENKICRERTRQQRVLHRFLYGFVIPLCSVALFACIILGSCEYIRAQLVAEEEVRRLKKLEEQEIERADKLKEYVFGDIAAVEAATAATTTASSDNCGDDQVAAATDGSPASIDYATGRALIATGGKGYYNSENDTSTTTAASLENLKKHRENSVDDDHASADDVETGHQHDNASSARRRPTIEMLDFNDAKLISKGIARDALALQFASVRLKDDETLVMDAVTKNGLALAYASTNLRNKKGIVLAAIANGGTEVLQYASEALQDDDDVRMAVDLIKNRYDINTTGTSSAATKSLSDASYAIRNNKHIVKRLVSQKGSTLKYASNELKNDDEIVLTAIKNDGRNLRYASTSLQSKKDIVIAAVAQNGLALEDASVDLKNDEEVVMEAISQSAWALPYASDDLQAKKRIVMKAVSQNGLAIRVILHPKLRDDKEIVLAAISQNCSAFKYVSDTFGDDKEIVIPAVSQNGNLLRLASWKLQGDKEVILAAVKSKPASLKFAVGGLNQDRDCLIAAGLWDDNYDEQRILRSGTELRKIVLSTRFSLAQKSQSTATHFTVLLKRHPGFRTNREFLVYSPNAFNKGTCDEEWTRYEWPCRGTFETCLKEPALKVGVPIESECCWRYSFRYHLQKAKETNGFMIQVIEHRKQQQLQHSSSSLKKESAYGSTTAITNRSDYKSSVLDRKRRELGFDSCYDYELGKGQQIESDMASQVGTKVFVAHQPCTEDEPHLPLPFTQRDINAMVKEIMDWYDMNDGESAEAAAKATAADSAKKTT